MGLPQLHVVGVVQEIVFESVGERQGLDLLRAPVDGDAAEVLQRRCGGVHWFGEEQLYRSVRTRGRLRIYGSFITHPGQQEIVFYQMDNTVKLLQFWLYQNNRVQFKLPVFELNA